MRWLPLLALAPLSIAGSPRSIAATRGQASAPAPEAPLVVVTTYDRSLTAPVAERFRAEHPGVAVELVELSETAVLERVRRERAAPRASVWWGGDDLTLELAAREGLLAPSDPTWARNRKPEERDASGRWHAQFLEPLAVADRRGAPDPPVRFDNLADPEYKGRVVLASPDSAPFMRLFYGAMIAPRLGTKGTPEPGFEWIEKFIVNSTGGQVADLRAALKLVAASSEPRRADLTIGVASEIDRIRAEDSLAIDFFVPISAPAFLGCAAKIAGAPKDALADAFLETIGGAELAAGYVRRGKIPLPVESLGALTLPAWMNDAITQTRTVPRDLLATRLPEWMKSLRFTRAEDDPPPRPEGLGSIALDALDVFGTVAVIVIVVVILRRQRRGAAG